MKYSKCQEVDKICKQLISQGWSFEPKGRSRHDKLVTPGGRKIAVLREDGDRRAIQNWTHFVLKAWNEGDKGENSGGP
jgi:hypothetical protein